jgi:ectoine hydroxylase-related dioxygenase (phytanoyl-CoA dioxygenase family)
LPCVVSGLSTEAFDQIDRLTASNRRDRSVETDEHLARLRRDAALQVAEIRTAENLEFPAVDLFAGTTGLPEIEATRLTAAHLASGILHHGALLVRGAVDAEHLAVMTTYLDNKEAATRATAHLESDEARKRQLDEGARETMRKGLPRMMCTPSALFEIIEMYKDVGLGRIIEEYLGERPVLLADRIRLTRQRGGVGLPWHQDAAFYGGVFRAVNVWLAISPCGTDAPGLSIVPRRMSGVCAVGPGETLPLALSYGERFTPELVEQFAAGREVANPEFRPGDVLLFDELTLHRTSPRTWKFPYRDSAVTWFLAPSRLPASVTPLIF